MLYPYFRHYCFLETLNHSCFDGRFLLHFGLAPVETLKNIAFLRRGDRTPFVVQHPKQNNLSIFARPRNL